jgi:Tol biopolymer transport system component
VGARLRTAVVGACFIGLFLAVPAQAAFPGANGKIAFSRCTWTDVTLSALDDCDIWMMKADGTGQANITNTPGSNGRLSEKDPAWSPDGTKIAFVTKDRNGFGPFVYTMNADGSGVTLLLGDIFSNASYGQPDWSPDGSSLVYSKETVGDWHIWRAKADGTQQTQLTYDPACCVPADHRDPNWSPDGTEIEYRDYQDGEHLMNADGSNQRLASAFPARDAQWSPDASRVVYADDCCSLFTARRDFSNPTQVNETSDGAQQPDFSPDGTKIVFGGSPDYFMQPFHIHETDVAGTADTALTSGADTWDQQPDWQPLPITGYPRPRGASPMRIALVPAYNQCTSATASHGAPLAYGSCGPPQLASTQLTTGSPDSNGLPVRMDASLLLRVVPGNSQTPADEADVRIDAHVNDVFKKDFADYTGALRANVPLEITDKDNTPSPGGPGVGTTVPFIYGFDIPCTADPTANIGSNCEISTTADTLVSGTIKESLRTIWQTGRVRVDDSGPDRNPDTTADNTVFVVQGVFVP